MSAQTLGYLEKHQNLYSDILLNDRRNRLPGIRMLTVRYRPSLASLRSQNAAIPVGGMDLDDLLQRYFGTSDLSEASPAVREAGVDRMLVDLGLKQIDHGGSHCGPCYTCLAKHRSLMPPSIRRLIAKPRAI